MKALDVYDLRGHVFLSFAEIFTALPSRALLSAWQVAEFIEGEESLLWVGQNDGEDGITPLLNAGRVSGKEMARIAAEAPQVIWGSFLGFDPRDAAEPWITLHAIDSSFWRCETRDIATRQALMKSFKDVRLVES